MDREAVLSRLDRERRSSFPGDAEGEVLPELTRVRGREPEWHCIEFSRLDSANAERVIAEQVAHYRALRAELEWKVYSQDTPSDLRERLERQGFRAGARESVLVLELSQPPVWLSERPRHRVLRVTRREQLRLFASVAEQGSARGRAAVAAALLRHMERGSTEQLGYVAFDGDVPAAIGRLETRATSAFGGLYGGLTLEAHRGRGLYHALIAERARDALRLGARYLRVDALPTSEGILERLGFVKLADTWPYVLPRSDAPAGGG
ncbi:MAG TPA: hypothetical protein VFS67_13605 [Polyangiaceae bacterium]|jgi:hypothetical protein|nr:hypothetical protein [Polyangiaceae bacterium]